MIYTLIICISYPLDSIGIWTQHLIFFCVGLRLISTILQTFICPESVEKKVGHVRKEMEIWKGWFGCAFYQLMWAYSVYMLYIYIYLHRWVHRTPWEKPVMIGFREHQRCQWLRTERLLLVGEAAAWGVPYVTECNFQIMAGLRTKLGNHGVSYGRRSTSIFPASTCVLTHAHMFRYLLLFIQLWTTYPSSHLFFGANIDTILKNVCVTIFV